MKVKQANGFERNGVRVPLSAQEVRASGSWVNLLLSSGIGFDYEECWPTLHKLVGAGAPETYPAKANRELECPRHSQTSHHRSMKYDVIGSHATR